MSKKIYWQVEDKKTKSKGQALLWAKGDLSKISFYFYDEEWKNNDFTLEPTESFEELAKKRCNYLRSTCDWLVLWLSSGYDSNTALKYFMESGNKIDEIIIYQRSPLFDNEYVFALQTAENYKKYFNSAVKINFLPISHNHIMEIYNKLKHDYINQPGLSLRFTKTSPLWQVTHHSTVLSTLEKYSNKRIDVCGFEKPKVDLYQDRWYAVVPDTSVYDTGIADRLTGFFIDVTDFQFYIKQHFMVIKWFEHFKNLTNELVHEVQSHKKYYKEWNLACGRIPVHSDYSIGAKGKNLFMNSTESADSKPYIIHFKENKIFDHWQQGIESIKQYYTWWSEKDDIDIKTTILSKPKFIKKYEKKI